MLTQLFAQAQASMVRIRRQEGASAVEYGLILGLIAVVIVAILITMGGDLQTLFGEAASGLTEAATQAGSP